MPKGGGKGASAKAAKAAHADEVKSKHQQQAEAVEASKWADGAKGKASKEDKAEKSAALKAAKAERERLLAEEEANTPSVKPKVLPNKSVKKVKPPPASSGSMPSEIPEYSASKIDDIADVLDHLALKNDKATMGAKAAQTVDAHPERRFKAAFEAYKEKELPIARKEHPGLRLQQYHDLLYKQFQKHPDNPHNQLVVAYDATKDEKMAALQAKRQEVDDRLRTR